MNFLRFPGEVNSPGFLMVCVKCGFVVDYDCGCDGPFSTRDYRDARHFNSVDDAKAAATVLRAELEAAQTPPVASEPRAKSGRRDRSNGQVPDEGDRG